MEVTKQTKLKFTGVDFVNVDVKLINRLEGQPAIDISIIPKVFYPADLPSEFTIIFDVKINAKDFFSISIVGFGFFSFEENAPEEDLKKAFININAPAIMFPYVRSFITTLTANLGLGFAPILLPPHFFQGELEEYIVPSTEPVSEIKK